MNRFLYFFLPFIFISCGNPLLVATKTYELEVPLEKQVEVNFCVPTSVLMCAEYFANDVGWYDKSFADYDVSSKELFIYNYLKNNSGLTFYPDKQFGAPLAISNFLYRYLNISNREIAVLDTSFLCEENYGSLKLIIEQIKLEQKPLIAIINSDNSGSKTHAVVVRGIQENIDTGDVSKIYYNDPWYGYRNKTRSSWKNISCLSSFDYLTLYFSDYNN